MDTLTNYSDRRIDAAPPQPDPSASDNVVVFDTTDVPRRLKGDKAAALELIASSGLPTPPWFLVLPEALFSATRLPQREEFLRQQDPVKAKYFAQRRALSQRAIEEIASGVNRLLRPSGERAGERDAHFAVRVSLDPDEAASRLTNIEPLLYLSADDIAAAALRLWQAVYSEDALHRRIAARQPLVMPPPAIIVQRMVRADVSGLAYGGDPLSGRRGVTVVAAVFGLGTSIVSGESDADTYEVDRERAVIRRDIACKQISHVLDLEFGHGVRTRLIPPEQQDLPLLTNGNLMAISDMAWRLGDLCQMPQEVEWAMEAGHISLLGSRPAPALPRLADPDAPAARWSRSAISGMLPGVLSTLSYTLARAMTEARFRELARLAGVSDNELRISLRRFSNVLGSVNGVAYLNSERVKELLAFLPLPNWHRAQLVATCGCGEAASTQAESKNENETISEGADDIEDVIHLDVLGNSRSFSALQAQSTRHEALSREYSTRLNRVLSSLSTPLPLSRKRLDELILTAQTMIRECVDAQDAPGANELAATSAEALLGQLTRAWCDDGSGALLRDLLLDLGDVPGTAAARSMTQIAAAVSLSNLTDEFLNGTLAAVRRALELDAHTALRVELDEYLDAWGDVIPEGFKVEGQTLREDPLPLIRLIGLLAADSKTGEAPRNLLPSDCVRPCDAEATTAARARAERYFSDRTLRRRHFEKVYLLARQHVRYQEQYEFDRVRIFAALRILMLEIGKRLYAINVLESPAQIIHLELSEIIGYAEGTGSCSDLRGLAEVRGRQYSQWKKQIAEQAPPDHLSTSLPIPQPVLFA